MLAAMRTARPEGADASPPGARPAKGAGMSWWQRNRERYQALLAEYGTIALGTWFAIAAICFVGFVIAIGRGFEVEGAASDAGIFVAAWIGIKLIQPLRIVATLVATPLVARVLRFRRTAAERHAAGPVEGG